MAGMDAPNENMADIKDRRQKTGREILSWAMMLPFG
jgi:hypothetical protein